MGADAREHLGDAQKVGEAARYRIGVAREHHRFHTHGFQGVHRLDSVFLGGVEKCDHAAVFAVPAHHHRGAAISGGHQQLAIELGQVGGPPQGGVESMGAGVLPGAPGGGEAAVEFAVGGDCVVADLNPIRQARVSGAGIAHLAGCLHNGARGRVVRIRRKHTGDADYQFAAFPVCGGDRFHVHFR